MPRANLSAVSCSIARSIDLIGDAWTLLILRDVFAGITRFDALARDLGVSRKVLAARLDELVGHGLLRTEPYSERPPRHDYVPTEKGADLYPVVLALLAWGDRWTARPEGPPALIRHDSCGAHATPVVTCSHCSAPLTLADTTAEAGPGGRAGRGTAVLGPLLAANAPGGRMSV
jgi:DNA-binding HxlR family transcriptional regulator